MACPIVSVESFANRWLCLVRVVAADGMAGWGQCAPFNADITQTILHRQVAPQVLGLDDADPDAISQRCIDIEYKFFGTYLCRAVAGVDSALWDLAGKRAGRSVCELLGGRVRPRRVYASSMSRQTTPEQEVDRLARLRDEQGFSAFKIKIGGRMGHDLGRNADAAPGRSEGLIRLARARLGADAHLIADANGSYSPDVAIEWGRRLERLGYAQYEEPCPFWEIEQTAKVASALDIPVSGGEQDNSLPHWQRLLDMGAVDIAQPDVCYVGGVSRLVRVARMASEKGISVMPHSANHSMLMVFTLHLAASLPNAAPLAEWCIEHNQWTNGLYEPPLRVENGFAVFPDAPGWGVTPCESWLRSAGRMESRLEG